jgi:hypothetical protein
MMFRQYSLEVLLLNFIYWPNGTELSTSIASELYNYRTSNVICCSVLYVNPLVPSDTYTAS